MNILDEYITSQPSKQNVIDLFQGEWSSRFPSQMSVTATPGTAALFEDDRIHWAESQLGSFENLRFLELGPLEGGHSYMLEAASAKQIVAIEANKRAFVKCLCVKELLGMNRVKFLLGDFVPYLENNELQFDVAIASGVLYHMSDPVKLLALISKAARKVFLWTHYYDHHLLRARGELAHKFSSPKSHEFEGFTYEGATQSYKQALEWSGFCGGGETTSRWLTRESILGALQHFGYREISIGFDQPDHVNGPSFAVCAQK
jgi:hypothetical protein